VIANIKARLKKLRRLSTPQQKRYFAGLTGLRFGALHLRFGGSGFTPSRSASQQESRRCPYRVIGEPLNDLLLLVL
jgi:hypothetical protein